ncbi:MAG: hypothetical protein ACERLB_10340, partial [Gammaproteobacteria bacterium]
QCRSNCRGCRDAAVVGCADWKSVQSPDRSPGQAASTLRQIGCKEHSPLRRAYRHPQQNTGEKSGLDT